MTLGVPDRFIVYVLWGAAGLFLVLARTTEIATALALGAVILSYVSFTRGMIGAGFYRATLLVIGSGLGLLGVVMLAVGHAWVGLAALAVLASIIHVVVCPPPVRAAVRGTDWAE